MHWLAGTWNLMLLLASLLLVPLYWNAKNSESLHAQDSKCLKCFDAVGNHYSQMEMSTPGAGELATFLDNYTTQVEVLLHLIRASHRNDLEGFWAALNEQIKYFMAHDLFKYARLMPVHLAQIKVLERDDPVTWSALKNSVFESRRPLSLLCLWIRPSNRK